MVKSLKISKLAVTIKTNLLMEIQPLDQLTKIINDALNGTAKIRKSFSLKKELEIAKVICKPPVLVPKTAQKSSLSKIEETTRM